ncbi:DUF6146 family protein [Bizionia sediminis]|uniref:DUF6146 family protein n=1 Tax=Bizionia sediminis TaxID=1737064 RepID=A0ABW5KT87_9FLAO
MKTFFYILILACFFSACQTTKKAATPRAENSLEKQDTIKITNTELEYEVIIVDTGFETWMASRAKPRSFYTQSFLEARNSDYVTEWNSRVTASNYSTNLYQMPIDYNPGTDYGFEVNYILYHYFVFFQEKYKQQLSSHNPRF